MRNHLLLGQGLAGFHHNHGAHSFHPFGIGQANHGHLADLRQAVNHFLDLAAGHVLAAGLDHVFLAVDHGDEAFLVDGGQVAAVEPIAFESVLGALVVMKVAQHQVGRAVHDFAHFARSDIAHLIVHHPGFHIEHGAATRAGLAQLVVRAEHGGQGRNFGLAVQVPQAHRRQARGQLTQHFHRHDGGAVIAFGQMFELGGIEQGRAQQGNPDRGRREETGDLVGFHQAQQVVGHGLGGDDVAAADKNGGAKKHIELRAVVQRQRMQGQVIGGNFGIDHAADVLPQHGIVGQHGALGRGLGAAGVDNLRQVGAGQGDIGQGIGAGCKVVKTEHARTGLAGIFRGQPDELLHLGVERRGRARQLRQAGVCRQSFGARMAQDVGHLFGLEHEIDGHQHRAQSRQGKTQSRKAVRVARQHGHAIGGVNALLRQACRESRHQGIELGVGPFGGATADGHLGGHSQSGAAQDIGQSLTANDGMHVCLHESRTVQLADPGARVRAKVGEQAVEALAQDLRAAG